jgi:hypothetical protein
MAAAMPSAAKSATSAITAPLAGLVTLKRLSFRAEMNLPFIKASIFNKLGSFRVIIEAIRSSLLLKNEAILAIASFLLVQLMAGC